MAIPHPQGATIPDNRLHWLTLAPCLIPYNFFFLHKENISSQTLVQVMPSIHPLLPSAMRQTLQAVSRAFLRQRKKVSWPLFVILWLTWMLQFLTVNGFKEAVFEMLTTDELTGQLSRSYHCHTCKEERHLHNLFCSGLYLMSESQFISLIVVVSLHIIVYPVSSLTYYTKPKDTLALLDLKQNKNKNLLGETNLYPKFSLAFI